MFLTPISPPLGYTPTSFSVLGAQASDTSSSDSLHNVCFYKLCVFCKAQASESLYVMGPTLDLMSFRDPVI